MVTRRPAPGFVLVVGLTCAVTAGGFWALHSTITDERTIENEAHTIAQSEPVREEFGRQIAEAMVPHSAQSSPEELNRSNEVGRQAVRTPEFEQAFALALPTIYQRVVNGSTTEVLLDPALINGAIASTGSPVPTVQLTVGADALPDLRKPLDFMQTATAVLGVLALLLIGIGLGISPHRGRAIMRIGRWLITTGVMTILVFWALPTLALLPIGGWIGVVGIVLSTADWLLVPAAILAAFGIAILVIGRAGEAEERRHELSRIPQVAGRVPVRPGY